MAAEYSLFDLHCDTALKLFTERSSLRCNDTCHISLKKAAYLKKYAQIFAIFTERSRSNYEGYASFIDAVAYFNNELKKNSDIVSPICKTSNDIKNAICTGKAVALLSIEDARILDGNLKRTDKIFDLGVRLVTPVWSGVSCIGGAHDTNVGLTEFGKKAVTKMIEKGIILDISHSSEATASEIMDIAQSASRPVIATHSNAYSVHPHSRNLRDTQFYRLKSSGGLVGISLCPFHLAASNANIDDIIKHIDKYMELGGDKNIALGADLDGTELPKGFNGVYDIYKIADKLLSLGYSTELTERIFFKNAYEFMLKNL